MLGFAGMLALRATIAPPPRTASAPDATADEVVLVNLTAKADSLPTADEKKIVTVERIHLAALQANAKADAEPKTHYRRHVFRHHLRLNACNSRWFE
jgi:hypothetical protein